MASLRDEDLKPHIMALIPEVDLETTGLKKFTKLLSKKLDGLDLSAHKPYIKTVLTEEITKISSQDASESEASDDDDNEEEGVSSPKKKKGGGGLAQKKKISAKLAAFLGKGDEMARTEIVKGLWEYIREHDLQDPSNKRNIRLDDAMKDVFGCDSFTMFTMNKYVSAHIEPFPPVDLTPTPSKTPNKKRKKAQAASSEKKKRKTGTQPPYQLSDDLAQVVGASILPRPQVVKKIWEYIRQHDLQDPSDKRQILCDEKLQAVMRKSKVSMFKMNQLITPHLLEKVDRSMYQHEDDEGSDED